MKKRIGSKLYDTESSELVGDVGSGVLYRKRTREREWFMVREDRIIPLEDHEAAALIGDRDPEPENKRIMIGIDRETHAVIAAAAKKKGITIAEEIRQLVRNMI